MNSRLKKILLWLLAAALLAGSGQVQQSLNRDRQELELTQNTPLKNAPPLLAFTTVALGGFRGLISNFLWIRANDLQQQDKYFEMVQLADWITDLEPHFEQVWVFQAWNMAWNISVNFKDFSDRWRWVERGMELLRDDGLRYNPNSILLYQQMSWIFQSKMGQNMDDANQYYKEQWAGEMMPFFGPNGTNFVDLINPANRRGPGPRRFIAGQIQDGSRLREKSGRRLGPVRLAVAGGERDLLGRARPGKGEGKPGENSQAIRIDHAPPLHLPVHASGALSWATGHQSL